MEAGIGSTKIFLGSSTTAPTVAKLIWSEYGYQQNTPVIPPNNTNGTTPNGTGGGGDGGGTVTPPTPTSGLQIAAPVSLIGFLMYLLSF